MTSVRRIAVDAMGGDHAPSVEVEAAVSAVREAKEPLRVVLVGDSAAVREALERAGAASERRIDLHHASEVISDDEAPSAAVRSKRDSSMRVSFELVKRGDADAVVSAGHSGAMLACGTLLLGRLPGVDRAAVVATVPSAGGGTILCDVGANVEPRPEVLAQFGILGVAFAQVVRGLDRPRLGLLSNGEESSKGTELTRAAHAILDRVQAKAGFRYVGYVEGKDLFGDGADVVCTDGFTGNVVLKAIEGAATYGGTLLGQSLASTPRARLGGLLASRALRALRRRLDWAEAGGAPLLGVDGVAVLAHGRSTARAIANAIASARRFVDQGLIERVGVAMGRLELSPTT